MITTLISRTRVLLDGVSGLARPVAPLLIRLVFGVGFLLAGLGKWSHFAGTVAFFREVGLPAPAANAALVATLELAGGAALVLGLGSRLFALLLSGTMVVALLTADRATLLAALQGHGPVALTGVAPLVHLLALAAILVMGPGPLSADALLARRAPGRQATVVLTEA
jgi:putative oxidoreductase